MKKTNKIRITLLCMFVITTGAIITVSQSIKVYGEQIDVHGSIATKGMMQKINVQMADIMGAILKGDSATVTKRTDTMAEISGSIMNEFFPKDGQVGRKFKVSDESMRGQFEKFVQIILDNSKNMAASAEAGDLSEVYESFDNLFRKACLACHKTTRDDWLHSVIPTEH